MPKNIGFTPFRTEKLFINKNQYYRYCWQPCLFFKSFPYEGSAIISQFSQKVGNERTLTQFLNFS